MTSGLRTRRYASRPPQDKASYSATVFVGMSPMPRRSRSPAVAWWTRWACRQHANVEKVNSPSAVPSQALARLDARNDPCVQSWKMMNVRIRKPAAGIASARVRRYETPSVRYITADSARYGATDVATSRALHRGAGGCRARASRARTDAQASRSLGADAEMTSGGLRNQLRPGLREPVSALSDLRVTPRLSECGSRIAMPSPATDRPRDRALSPQGYSAVQGRRDLSGVEVGESWPRSALTATAPRPAMG